MATAAAGATALALCLAGADAASATTARTAAHRTVSATDRSFIRSNGQTNLAEIALGTYVVNHAKDPRAVELARMTRRDHRAAEAELRNVASKAGVRVPDAPNKDQKALLAQLHHVKRIDYHYFIDQIAGHKLSIAGTRTELTKGSNAAVKKYAAGYLPVAQKHLRMSERDFTYWKNHH
jgi:putative membrane protein